jgi:hypothetical protein
MVKALFFAPICGESEFRLQLRYHCVAWVNGALLADAFVCFVLNDSEGIEVLEKRRARKMTRMLPHLRNLN